MRKRIKEKGITLVALVVTIIILLILAGLTITVAIGNNGIVDRTKYASNTWKNTTMNETVMMEQMENDIDTLSAGSGGGSSSIVIKDNTGTPIELDNIASYYGHEVTFNGLKYQLFLVDQAGKYSNGEARIWLQYKEWVNYGSLQNRTELTGIKTANSVLWQVNPDLDSSYGDTIRGLDETELNGAYFAHLRAAAHLCNSENWNATYAGEDGEESGAYVIGAVSIEMYCDSYNQARNKTSSDADYFSAKAYYENNGYGYRYKPGGGSNINSDGFGTYSNKNDYEIRGICGKMYAIKTSTKSGVWIASPAAAKPSAYATGQLAILNGYDGVLTAIGIQNGYGLRPVVSLPSNIQIQLDN